jgi:hypothetical protein
VLTSGGLAAARPDHVDVGLVDDLEVVEVDDL